MIQTDQLWEDIYETVKENRSILVLLNNYYQRVRYDNGTVVTLEAKKKKKTVLISYRNILKSLWVKWLYVWNLLLNNPVEKEIKRRNAKETKLALSWQLLKPGNKYMGVRRTIFSV